METPSSTVALEESIDASGGNSDQCTFLQGHMKGVRSLEWNPTVSNCFATASPDTTVRFWDVGEQKEMCEAVDLGYDAKVTSIGWNYNGTSLMASTMDKVLMIDARSNKQNTLLGKKAHAGGKGIKCQLLRNENFFCTIGFAKMAARELKVWDIRKVDRAVTTEKIDNGSGYFIPYDFDTSCLFLAANGEATIHVYDMRSDGRASLCAPCTVPGEPMAGITMLPKQSCNVKNVELTECYDAKTVQPISFQVPRSNDMLEYFQDDIFVPTRSCRANDMMDIPNYLQSKDVTAITLDLCPAGMKLVSKKPVVARKSVNQTQKYIDQERAKAEAKKVKDASFERLQALAVQHANYNVNQSMGKRRSVQQRHTH